MSSLTKEEKQILLELICNEQTIHLLAKNQYNTNKYTVLETLKAKIRTI